RAAVCVGYVFQNAAGVQSRVIDQPRFSPGPVAPNRVALLGVAFGASLLAGLAISFLASQAMPIFHDAITLRTVSNRPILGMVSMLPSKTLARLTRRRVYLFAGGLGSLFAAFMGVF